MKKNLLMCLLFVILGVNFAFGKELKTIVTQEDRVNTIGTTYKCADVQEGYIAEIVDYDLMNGIVKCKVRKKESLDGLYLTDNANMHFPKNSFNVYYERETNLISFKKIKNAISPDTKVIEIDYNDNGTTITDYLIGLAVLKDISVDAVKGVVRTESEINNDGNMVITTSEEMNLAKGFNQPTIDYYKNLFYNMNTVYIHLQNLLFIVVGGFFLATLGGQKIQKYLENRGQSTGQKEPYLHKFFIPLLCAAVFYMPISGSGGVNSTMIQKIIQYFTTEATAIANRASAIGLQSYATKVRNDLGLKEVNVTMPNTIDAKLLADFMVEYAGTEIDEKCKVRYKGMTFIDEATYNWVDNEIKNDKGFLTRALENFKNTIASIFTYDHKTGIEISTDACKNLINTYIQYKNIQKAYLAQTPEKGDTFKEKEVKDSVDNTYTHIETMLKNNEKMYGWIHSTIAPASLLLFEMQKASQFLKAHRQMASGEHMQIISKDMEKALHEKMNQEIDEGLINQMASYVIGRASIFILPGANSLYSFIQKAGYRELTKKEEEEGEKPYYSYIRGLNFLKMLLIQYYGDSEDGLIGALLGLGKANYALRILGAVPEKDSLLNKFIALETVYTFYIYIILEKFPILLVSMAGMLAFLSYFVTLCKYFYISPFVVAFALTTKRVDKIINFLVTGITIFFKPVLIVLFIYLSLFLISILENLYQLIVSSQFMVIPKPTWSSENSIDIATPILKTIIKTIMRILGTLASIYIVWKTIMTGPDWTFKLLGIDSSGDNTIVRDLSSKMEQKTVQI